MASGEESFVKYSTFIAIAVALSGPLQYGVGISILSTVLETVSDDLGFDKNVGGAVASAAFFFGAFMGGLLSGPLSQLSGTFTQSLVGFTFVTGSLLCALTTANKVCWGGPFAGCVAKMLFAGRLLSGVASGLAIVVSPRYLAEIAPPNVRGALGAASQLSVAIGTFLARLIGLPYEFDDSFKLGWKWWRIMFLIAGTPAVVQTIFGMPMPAFFQWRRGDIPRNGVSMRPSSTGVASASAISLLSQQGRSIQEVPFLDTPRAAPGHGEAWMGGASTLRDSLRLCFLRRYRRSLVLGVGVPFVCNLIGIDAVGAYTATVFEEARLEKPIIGSVVYGLLNIVASVGAVLVFDRLSRKTMAFASFAGMAVCDIAVALLSLSGSSASHYLAAASILAFVTLFSIGCGPLMIAYGPEVVPPEVSSVVLGTGQSVGVLTSLILVLVFPAVLDAIGAFGSFLTFFVFTLASLLFLALFMVETKGKELREVTEEIQRLI